MILIAVNFFQLITRFTFVYCTTKYNNTNNDNNNLYFTVVPFNIKNDQKRFTVILITIYEMNL